MSVLQAIGHTDSDSDDDFSVAEAVITAARTGKKFPLPRIDLEFTISHKKNSRISQCIKIVGLHNLMQFLGGTQVTATGSLISL